MVSRASAPGFVFIFCTPGLIFGGGTEGVASRILILCAQTHFRRSRGRRAPFSCFACRDLFLVVPRASGFAHPESFPRYRGRRVPFSSFALPDSFLVIPWESFPVFIFCALGLVFGGNDGVGSRLHILRARNHFRRYRGHRVTFSSFAFLDSICAVPRASGPVIKFCAPGLFFNGSEGVVTRFHVLSSKTRFRRYRGRRLPFSFFCPPGLIFGDTEGVLSRLYILRARTHCRR
jgi:hypothetical protein